MSKHGYSDGSVLARADGRFDYTRCPVCRLEVKEGNHDRVLHQVAALERIPAALETLVAALERIAAALGTLAQAADTGDTE